MTHTHTPITTACRLSFALALPLTMLAACGGDDDDGTTTPTTVECPAKDNATFTIKDGACVYTCKTNFVNNGTEAAPKCETCPARDHATVTIKDGACAYTCDAPFTQYGDKCKLSAVCVGDKFQAMGDDGSPKTAIACENGGFCVQMNSGAVAKCVKTNEMIFKASYQADAGAHLKLSQGTRGPFDYKCKKEDTTWTPAAKDGEIDCTYTTAGTYTVSVRGYLTHLIVKDDDNCTVGTGLKFVSVVQWGQTPWQSLHGGFKGCETQTQLITDTQAPVLTRAATLDELFHSAKLFNHDIGNWDTSKVQYMEKMFYDAEKFNQDISGWDTSEVTEMTAMFSGAEAFDQDLSGWDVDQVTKHDDIFKECPISEAHKPAKFKK